MKKSTKLLTKSLGGTLRWMSSVVGEFEDSETLNPDKLHELLVNARSATAAIQELSHRANTK